MCCTYIAGMQDPLSAAKGHGTVFALQVRRGAATRLRAVILCRCETLFAIAGYSPCRTHMISEHDFLGCARKYGCLVYSQWGYETMVAIRSQHAYIRSEEAAKDSHG
jgi:hypothetical protein